VKLLTDITPLREYPAFRRLWLGTMLSQAGSAMTNFALTLQVYDMTHSTAAVGGLGVATLVPMLVIALPGGSLADTVDRRKLVLAMTTCQTAVSVLLFAQALTGPGPAGIWLLYALDAASSAIGAISAPARTTFIPSLVRQGELATAMALNRIVFQTMLIAGPALAGVIAGAVGVKGCYLVDAVTFAGAFYGVGRLPAMPAPGSTDKKRGKLALTREGLSFIRRSQVLAGAFAADVSATFFALPLSLFPAINAERFGGDPRILGLFPAAIGIGGMLTAVLAGPVRHVLRHGLAMIVCVCVWGLSFAVFAVTPWLWLTLLSLGIAGAADTYTVVFRQVIVQTVTPAEFRGRVNAADYVVGAGGGQLGSLESGVLGALTSPMISALSGGLLTIAAALALGAALPGFRRYRAPDPAAAPAPDPAPAPAPPTTPAPATTPAHDNSKKFLESQS
jgi:MFS family permease